MSDGNSKMSAPNQNSMNAFLTPQNESMLGRLVYDDFHRRIGGDLNDKQRQRLGKTVRHYMNEVAQSMPGAPLKVKNQEVLSAVVPDFSMYLNRSAAAPPVAEADVSRMDVASRFNQLQNERNVAKAPPPAPPNFRIAMEDDGPSAISIFDQVKKAREEETSRGEKILAQNMRADAQFAEAQQQTKNMDQLVLADREQNRNAIQRESANEMASRFVSPDPRRIWMKDVLDGTQSGQGTSIETLLNGQSGQANADMTLAYPSLPRVKPTLPQDVLIRQDDILAYKENEYNLHVYSADRDWLINRNQNRYSFTVNFDPANNGPGFSYAPTASIKFKNITRIELVKTILPIEGVEILQTRAGAVSTGTIAYGTSLNTNILSFPFLNVYIPELDTNNYGTDYNLQQAFGVVQYDANWVSDNNTASKGGWLAMIPKFLKCQKVYTPTPLATLQKMTIRLQRPDGDLVSDTQDTLDISGFRSSYSLDCGAGNTNIAGTSYADTSGGYIWIQTSTWFSRFIVNQGDRIRLGGIQFPTTYTGNEAAKNDLITFLQQSQGHLVVGIANSQIGGGTTFYKDGSNYVGYSNYIIIRSKMADPTTGSTAVSTFGNLNAVNNNNFLLSLCTARLTTGRLINLSHQTTLVFRVITRDLDSTTRIRPDNL